MPNEPEPPPPEERTPTQDFMFLLGLIIAGEAAFMLRYSVLRVTENTALDVFGFTDLELGYARATYGALEMLCFVPGGLLADRYSARRLLSFSLLITALGGLFYATIPSLNELILLFAFFGIANELLLWSALIRATREWGGERRQGRAYGLLDGGRGLFGALVVTAAFFLFSAFMGDEASRTDADKQAAVQAVILFYTAITFVAAIAVWFLVPDPPGETTVREFGETSGSHLWHVLRMPTVWVQAAIIICAYVCFRLADYYPRFAAKGLGLDEVDAASTATVAVWVRPFAAVGAGFLGDRFRSSSMCAVCFVLLIVGYLSFLSSSPEHSTMPILYTNVVVTMLGAAGLRGLYHALFAEGGVPPIYTGTAVGVVSLIGFTPDLFVPLAVGHLLGEEPGFDQFQFVWQMSLAFAIGGLVLSLVFRWMARSTARLA